MSGKGSARRKEDTQKVENNLMGVKFGVRDKSRDTFKVTVKGKPNVGNK